MNRVLSFVRSTWMNMFNVLIRNDEWNFLFYFAMLPAFLMICFDIIMSIICSIRLRELKFFNVFSPRSWSTLSSSATSVANHPRDYGLKYSRFGSLALHFKSYRNAKAGDVLRCKDGTRFTYMGGKLHGNTLHHVYRSSNGTLYYSTLKPSKWVKSLGSSRLASVVHKKKKSD